MKPNTFLLLALMLLAVASCSEDDKKVAPPITAENTFSCKINGNLFLPEDHFGGISTTPGIILTTPPENSWLFKLANKNIYIYIYIYNVTATGDYIITASEDYGPAFVDKTENLVEMRNGESYYVSTNNNESITVSELELDTKIILEFDTITLVNTTDENDVIKLTEGKLNINLETFSN